MNTTPILQIVASRSGVDEVSVLGAGEDSIRLYRAVLPALRIINRALKTAESSGSPARPQPSGDEIR